MGERRTGPPYHPGAAVLAVIKPWIWIQIAAFIVLFALIATAVYGQIPPDAERYRREMVRNARLSWGLDAPIAMLAAQIQAESNFRPDAKSSVGALGIAQFMPATASWLAGAYSSVGPADAANPIWALRAHATYTKYLWDRTNAIDGCSHGAKMLASYNSGEGWLHKDEAICKAKNVCVAPPPPPQDDRVTAALKWVWNRSFGTDAPKETPKNCGCNESLWWDSLERINAPGRSEANWNQSRSYARRVLRVLEPHYVTAGWGRGVCTS